MAGGFLDKLIRTKEKWARKGRDPAGKGRDGGADDRLPPGQRLVTTWPVLDLGVQPYVAQKDWAFSVDGEVEAPLAWNWSDYMDQPQVSLVSDIHCVTAWSRYDNRWEGVSTAHLLDLVRPAAAATHVIQHSHDGYTTSVELAVFAAADALLAHSWEGEPLTREHGGPMRLVISAKYFWKSAKWLKRLEFVAADRPGFWEERGYHNEGDPWREERYNR